MIARIAFLAPLLMLGGCVVPVSVTPNLCRAMQARDMLQIRLMFGQSQRSTGLIPDAQWKDFVTREITPRFPSGLTIFDADGQWLDLQDHHVTHEPSRIVWIATPERRNLQHDLNAIRDAYKVRFAQQAVGMTIENGCSSF